MWGKHLLQSIWVFLSENNKSKMSSSGLLHSENRYKTVQCIFQLWCNSKLDFFFNFSQLRNGCSLAGFCYISLTDCATFGSIQSIYQPQWFKNSSFFLGFLIWFLFISFFFFRSHDSCLLPGEPCPGSEIYWRNTRGIWHSKDLWKLTRKDNNSGPFAE